VLRKDPALMSHYWNMLLFSKKSLKIPKE
jgi:hypothetical protein